jgi:hypothetical protein
VTSDDLPHQVRAGVIAIPTFMNDCKHPNGVGHTFLAQLILHRLLSPTYARGAAASTADSTADGCRGATASAAVVLPSVSAAAGMSANALVGPSGPSAAASAAVVLPTPYYGAEGFAMASSVCARGEMLSRYVEASDLGGFNLTDEGRGKGKLGYLAVGVGKSLSLCLPWPTEGARTKPPQVLWLGFLRSYEHMGRARLHCDGQCSCTPDVIDAHDIKDGVSVTDVRRLPLRPARRAADKADGCCRVHLHISAGTSSGEHKFKLMSLLLGGADATNLQVFSLRVAASASETPAARAPAEVTAEEADAAPVIPGKGRGRGRRRRRAKVRSTTN